MLKKNLYKSMHSFKIIKQKCKNMPKFLQGKKLIMCIICIVVIVVILLLFLFGVFNFGGMSPGGGSPRGR